MDTIKSMVFSLALATAVEAGTILQRASTTHPDWFKTSPDLYAGVMEKGAEPYLGQINPAPFGSKTDIPNDPLETGEPISGAKGRNIFHLMGDLSPYFSPVEGFGVDEYPLPKGANITQMHLLQRHGSRYPSATEAQGTWGEKITNATKAGTVFTGELAFLNDWSYQLGKELLVPTGRQELFDSGVLNYYNYGHLYNNNTASHKLVVRTTLMARMMQSAENFLAGFFGLNWKDYANLLATIDPATTGVSNCTNEFTTIEEVIEEPVGIWMATYLKERTAQLKKLSRSYNWTLTDTYHAQTLCPYETIGLGYSNFCSLFTFEDWEHYEYLQDIEFAGYSGFLSPTGRAQDTNPVTFPLDQNLYLEFTHDANLISVITAFGLTQFSGFLPVTGPPANQKFHTSRLVPFAGRLNIEIIKAPHKVSTRRSSKATKADYISGTGETQYVHFIQNQRTVPLHASFDACEYREDGWCELSTFLKVQKTMLVKAEYQHACYGNWTYGGWGTVLNGVPAS
ncbi:uncharacterized protein N7477_003879 [Penicillium maclennaniae]|uniref:uncharacterized protein n=1 Tax=Penicillium maclennaniae TaxID=1343394 RepID=UPI002542153D|nr:uncharacterized protein N7477_003879 [Penicillium maclennaniae]KAJ5678246.1 hypothetical protein N7477_003879 [Penicillium maclennaniae]